MDMYEASDESSETEFLDQSLTIWNGWTVIDKEAGFRPYSIDIFTASSLGLYNCVVEELLTKNVDEKNKGGWTPLMYSSYIGYVQIVDFLLNQNAHVDLVNNEKKTALMLAASCGNLKVVMRLCKSKANLDNIDCFGWTALFHSTYYGQHNVVKYLMDNGAIINIRENRNGMTAFMEASCQGHEIIIKEFLNHNVDVTIMNNNGDTARSIAIKKGFTKIVKLIDEYISVIQRRSKSNNSSDAIFDINSAAEEGLVNSYLHFQSEKLKLDFPNIGEGPDALCKIINDESPDYHSKSTISNNHGNFSALHIDETNKKSVTKKESPNSLEQLLTDINLSKYYKIFEQQDVDLTVFLSLNDYDLKELGVRLLGPRRKMLNSIERYRDCKLDKSLIPENFLSSDKIKKIESEILNLKEALSKESQLRIISETCLVDLKQRCIELEKFPNNIFNLIKDIKSYYTQLCIFQEELTKRFECKSRDKSSQLSPYNDIELTDCIRSVSMHVTNLIDRLYNSTMYTHYKQS